MEESTSSDSPVIRSIRKGDIHRICAGQVILDLPSAVKELVENSLDAGASRIEISLKGYGEESFQVTDDGYGISSVNFQILTRKHHTSKLSDFSDLQSLDTFGFRGEALSALCALGNLTVETRTKSDITATRLTFDHSGMLASEEKTARRVGTTVTLSKLFLNLPVRRKEFCRHIRKEYGKLISLLSAYAIISRGVRIMCTNTTGKNVKSVVINTQGSDSMKCNIISVFGMSTFSSLEPLNICMSDSIKVDGFVSKPGFGGGHSSGDKQLYFLNGRPVDLPKVSKLVNELYKGTSSRNYPAVILNFTIPIKECDVNVTPDKRKVYLSDEGFILSSLREQLGKIYSPNRICYSPNNFEEFVEVDSGKSSHNLGKLSPQQPFSNPDNLKEDTCDTNVVSGSGSFTGNMKYSFQPSMEKGFHWCRDQRYSDVKVHGIKKVGNDPSYESWKKINSVNSEKTVKGSVDKDSCSFSNFVQTSLTELMSLNKRKHGNVGLTLSEVPVLRNHCEDESRNSNSKTSISRPVGNNYGNSIEANEGEPVKHHKVDNCSNVIGTPFNMEDNFNGEFNEESEYKSDRNSIEIASAEPSGKYLTADEDVLRGSICGPLDSQSNRTLPSSDEGACPTLHFNFKDLKMRRQWMLQQLGTINSYYRKEKTRSHYADATLASSQIDGEEHKTISLAAAANELERLFHKKDFESMKVIGQFNLGFIIGKLGEDLFIVDQHAADEKYNFEHLSQSTILCQQPLLRPLRLQLSPEEEVVASMNIDIIRKNGFILEEDVNARPGNHFQLKAVPFSKNITFGVEDIKDLISSLCDGDGECEVLGSYRNGTAESICPSRVRAMFASRACKSSVVIGDALGKDEMKRILVHLGGLKSPWNCPHGRPTMRHLLDLAAIHRLDAD